MPQVIEVDQLTKYYGNFPALDDVSFQVGKGEILGFLGPQRGGEDHHHAHHHRLYAPLPAARSRWWVTTWWTSPWRSEG